MRVASVNVHKTSDPEALASWLHEFAWKQALDAACLQEMTRPHGREIREEFGPGWRLAQLAPGPGAMDQAVLYDWTALSESPRCVRMGRKGWFGWRTRRQHAPRWMTHVRIEGILLGSTHAPPGVDVTVNGLRGKADRQLAWISFVRAVRRWAKKNPGPFVIAADWNDPARARGVYSIRWLAKKTGARIYSAGGIDYVLARGVQISDMKKLPGGPGMDHPAFIFTVN